MESCFDDDGEVIGLFFMFSEGVQREFFQKNFCFSHVCCCLLSSRCCPREKKFRILIELKFAKKKVCAPSLTKKKFTMFVEIVEFPHPLSALPLFVHFDFHFLSIGYGKLRWFEKRVLLFTLFSLSVTIGRKGVEDDDE